MDYRVYSFTRRNGRAENQDYLFYEKKQFAESETLLLFGVCDGMGGMDNGSEISRLTAWTFEAYFSRYMAAALAQAKAPVLPHSRMEQILIHSVKAVQKTICAYMIKHEIDGGSTLTAAVIDEKMLYVVNSGDSPCYLINRQRESIELISEIENFAYEGLKQGKFTDVKSREFYRASSYLTNFIGSQRFREPKVRRYPVIAGDLILMGSDGLFGNLDQTEIFQEAVQISAVKLLEQLACRTASEGETDNQSGIVCRVTEI